jgi:hypothetical protein
LLAIKVLLELFRIKSNAKRFLALREAGIQGIKYLDQDSRNPASVVSVDRAIRLTLVKYLG